MFQSLCRNMVLVTQWAWSSHRQFWRNPNCSDEHHFSTLTSTLTPTKRSALGYASTEDLHYLEPSAWCYWQPVEHRSPWGLVEAHFSPNGSRSMAMPYPKHYVFAHFTRFLRPGMQMLRSTQPWVAM
eukprot:5391277-Amphidinium_carterae.1